MDLKNNISMGNKEDSGIDASDYFIKDAGIGGEILQEIKSIKVDVKDDVIYGVSDHANRPFLKRVDDFFVDNSKISLKDKSYFFHMLAVMVDSGVPVVSAVETLAGYTDNVRLKRILNTVAYNCRSGATLADAMSRFQDVFSEAEVGIVRAGEETGRLNATLFNLSEQLDKQHELNMKLWSAAVYPIAVLVVLVLVTVGMLIWVLPNLLSLLTEGGMTNDKLPTPTRILVALQTGFVDYWWAILIVLFGGYGLFKVYTGTDYGAVKWDYMKLRIPLIGKLLRKVYVLRFVSMMGLLIQSGIPVIKVLKVTGNSISNRVYKLKAQEIIDKVKTGEKISESMSDSAFLFPYEIVEMIKVGESSAQLSEVSEKISVQYQREVDNTLRKVTSLFEPLMILVVGLFVALLAIAIMSPIFNLNNVVTLK
ncbi:MAG: type II secretion system F family protein [Candidatus Gracilibacteria bacterium]|jgi:type IV pilus assembly protein PilC